jgi:hypothetical protein
MTTSFFESENAGRSWALRREYTADLARAEEIIAPIVDADLLLAGRLFDLRTLTAHVEQVDTTHGFREGLAPRARWCLEVDGPHAREVRWEPADTRMAVPFIDRAALERFVRAAAAQEGEPGTAVAPVALWVTAVRARLPWSDTGEAQVTVRYQAGGVTHIAVERDERGAWLSGPQGALMMPPIYTYGRVQGQLAELTIDAHWSPWYDGGAAGTAAIERAVTALEAKGWTRA